MEQILIGVNEMKRIKEASILNLLLGLAVGLIVVLIIHQSIDDEPTLPTDKEIASEKGIYITSRQNLYCVNGWTTIGFGIQGYVYARDENFKPIPCEIPTK